LVEQVALVFLTIRAGRFAYKVNKSRVSPLGVLQCPLQSNLDEVSPLNSVKLNLDVEISLGYEAQALQKSAKMKDLSFE